jgi:hypothetical protein
LQRRQGDARLDVGNDPIIDECGVMKGIATVDDATADGPDVRSVGNDPCLRMHQDIHEPLQPLMVIGDPALLHRFLLLRPSCKGL